MNPLGFTSTSSQGSNLVLDNYAVMSNAGDIPMIAMPGNGELSMQISRGAQLTPNFLDQANGGGTQIDAFTKANVFSGAFTGAGNIVFNYDTSVALTSQPGAGFFQPNLLNAGIPKGQTSLTAGVSPTISCPNLKITSTI